ncbi:MAG: hypothetical protein IPM07_09310 [Anaerolineales bacterium]|nr:hypothetical protein [Anaerolineales bacterium]
MTFDRGRLIDVTRVPVGADGSAQIDGGELGGQRNAVLAISALTPVTTEPAAYKYWIEDKN